MGRMANTNKTGFVLAGGGFKGAFEVGALSALIKDHGIVPDVITATSAGAVLGTVVAQGRDVTACARYVEVAANDLMAMTKTDVVFGEQPWLKDLAGTDVADAVHRVVDQHGRPELSNDWDELEAEAVDVMQRDGDAPGPSAKERLRHPFEQVATVVRDLHGKEYGLPRAALNLNPFEDSVRGKANVGIAAIDTALVGAPGMQLRLAVTALKARETRYITEEGVLVGPDAQSPVPGASIDVIDGMLASASVPGVFPAREIGGEHYVDGGCLQNIPLRAAVDLGSTDIYTLICVPVRTPKRTLGLWAAESLGYLSTQKDNLAVALPEGATNTIIEPTIEVVASFEVHPGLMKIDIDYGHMRASEVLTGLDAGIDPIVKMASDTITQLRRLAWRLENRLITAGSITPVQMARLRELKASVKRAVDARTAIGFATHPLAETWSSTWELHAGGVPDAFPPDLS